MPGLSSKSAIIASGTSLSGVVDLEGGIPTGILMPSAWTAANLTFQASVDGVTYQNVYDDAGTELVVTAAASRFLTFRDTIASQFAGMRYMKVRSGTSGTPVNQTPARTIYIATRFI